MEFVKYHGIGNDFILVADPDDRLELTPGLVRGLCDRRFGVGADGVIRVGGPADGGELFMDYVNSDGSVGEMCGNGIRCLALFARERGLTDATEIKVATRAGLKLVTVLDDGRVRVDMGEPRFDPASIPIDTEHPASMSGGAGEPARVTLEAGGRSLELTCLSMGNPHAVTFVDDLEDIDVAALGPPLESHPVFPHKANIEFVQLDGPGHLTMKVWERGAGATLACGTGACAAAVAARLERGVEERVTVSLPGGDLEVSWPGTRELPGPVALTGPAVKVFEGRVDLEVYG